MAPTTQPPTQPAFQALDVTAAKHPARPTLHPSTGKLFDEIQAEALSLALALAECNQNGQEGLELSQCILHAWQFVGDMARAAVIELDLLEMLELEEQMGSELL